MPHPGHTGRNFFLARRRELHPGCRTEPNILCKDGKVSNSGQIRVWGKKKKIGRSESLSRISSDEDDDYSLDREHGSFLEADLE